MRIFLRCQATLPPRTVNAALTMSLLESNPRSLPYSSTMGRRRIFFVSSMLQSGMIPQEDPSVGGSGHVSNNVIMQSANINKIPLN